MKIIILALAVFLPFPLLAAVHYVRVDSASPSAPYTSWATAAANIQDAVDASSVGDEVLVSNGVYNTGGVIVFGSLSNRVAVTLPITLQSVNGPAFTTIQGYQDPTNNFSTNCIRCVSLTNGASLTGFTLAGGATLNTGDGDREQSGGGIWCDTNNVTVSNCVFVGNSAASTGGGVEGGNLYNCAFITNSAGNGGGACDALIFNCTFTNNSAGEGGGACSSTVTNSVFTGNYSGDGGGGVNSCTANNCFFGGNSSFEAGGGAYASTINNCTLVTNSSNAGGGIGFCSVNGSVLIGNSGGYGGGILGGSIHNCTITGSSSWGVLDADCVNCIIYDNPDGNWALDGEIYGAFNYCCTTPLPAGVGNFTADPQLSSFSHISAGSPCRGAGTAGFTSGVDIDGESWLNPPSVGCDEFHAATATGPLSLTISAQYTSFPTSFSARFVGDVEGACTASRWDFGDGSTASNQPYTSHAWTSAGDYPVVLTAYNADFPAGVTATQLVHVVLGNYYVSQGNPTPAAPYTSWATAATNIQDAIDAAPFGGTVIVSNGVYATGGTVVYGTLTNRIAINKVIKVLSVNGPAFTAIQGWQDPVTNFSGNCVRCVYMTNGAMLSGFTLTNGATLLDPDQGQDYDNGVYQGGGIWCESGAGVVSNCVITGCFASDQGGGVMHGTCFNCSIVANHADVSASGFGGGVEGSTLYNCVFSGNTAYANGGGADDSTLNNCLLYGNDSGYGGGANNSLLNNCTVAANSASSDAGGVDFCTLNNTICYYNLCASNPNSDSSWFRDNCCTVPDAGSGNITNDPAFLDLSLNNFRLASNSPCINAGNNFDAPASPDLDGNPRIAGGTVDIGAYEFQSPTSIISYAWLQQYGLPTDGSADFADADHDGMSNWQEWIAGTDPTDSSSILKMLSVTPSTDTNNPGLVVTWQSVGPQTYYIQVSTNLAMQPAFTTIQTSIGGNAGSTSFLDTSATGPGPFYYRVGVQ